jgi:hypothetical protein
MIGSLIYVTTVNVYAIIIVLCISIDKSIHKNKITEKYTFTRDTTFILGNPLGEENPTKLPYHK